MLYSLAQKALFALDPERAHELTLDGLDWGHRLGATRLLCTVPSLPQRCMGLDFANPVGLAAGLDKNGDHFNALGDLGFGFIEIGTVTPRPQAGNPRPRVFRLPAAQAIINRLGFNNKGVDHLVARVRRRRYPGVLGINIGKNADTPLQNAEDDYLHCLDKVYELADYVTINISSPNTRQLRELQAGETLQRLLGALARRRAELAKRHRRRVPVAVKVSPDLDSQAIEELAQAVARHGMEAVIATNTTTSRAGVDGLRHSGEQGGLSGAPLKPLADEVLAALRQALPREVALIGVGGITCGQHAVDKLDRGASLVQFYTGMVYRGPALLAECVDAIAQRARA